MPTIKLTQVAVDRLTPPKTGRVEYFDSNLPGFALRIGESGHKSWVVFYRVAGRQRRYTIGPLAAYPKVETARDRAREILREAERGVDLAEEKKATALPVRAPDTVASLTGQFIERYAKPKNRSWAETEQTLQRHVVSRWGAREASSITRRDVLELLDALIDKGNPIAANRVLAAIRKMFGWAVERDILSASPVTNISAPGKEVERDRVLTDQEVARLWTAATVTGGIPGAFFKLLMLTGQRRDEVASLRWEDLDLDGKVWTLPREATKGDRSHEVPLSAQAVDALTALPRLGVYVLSTTRGDRPISGYSKMKERLAAKAGVEDWRIHDLRRTAGTGMARLGVAVSTISRVLNHKEGGVTKIYNRYSYMNEKRHGLELWGQFVAGLVNPPTDNVVALRAAAEPSEKVA